MGKHGMGRNSHFGSRRLFLQSLISSAGGAALAGCQGSSLDVEGTDALDPNSDSTAAAQLVKKKPPVQAQAPSRSTPEPITATASTQQPTPTVAVGRNALRISYAGGSLQNYPLQFGRPFEPGEIADSPVLLINGTAVASQADVKNRHADGSVRFAVISAVLPLVDGTERVLSFANNSRSSAPAALPISAMLADFDFEATIELLSASGVAAGPTASARAMLARLTDGGLDAATTAQSAQSRYWTRGPVCTTVILCDHETKSFDMGKTASKVIRPMFHVQFWPSIGRYHVRHIIEIADVTKLGDELGLTVKFSTGLSQPMLRLSQSGVNMYAGTWQSRAYWGGTDFPRVKLVHSLTHLSATRVIPNFDSRIVMNEAALASYATDWAQRSQALGSNGYWQKAMASTGGRPDLGLLPKWDVVSIYSGVPQLQQICERQAEFAGSWAFYFREGLASKTLFGTSSGNGRIVSKLSRPTMFLYDGNAYMANAAAADKFTVEGTLSASRDGWTHDHAHTPGMFWWMYLSTGQAFWHEKLLQLGAWSQFVVNPGIGYSTLGNGHTNTALILNGVQPRGFGWQFRNRARAWWAALDGTPERALFEKSLHDATAMRVGVYDLPGVMVGDPIRDGWNRNHQAWYTASLPRPRPNALGFLDRRGDYSPAQLAGAIGTAPPDDWGGSAMALWMQNYVSLSLSHAVELGYTDAKPLADFAARLTIAVANSSAPRHIADYILPDLKNDGGYYQTLVDLYDGYAHKADTANNPANMPANSDLGFSGAGAFNTYTVTTEGYGSIAAAAIAMANTAAGQSTAWAVVNRWHSATAIYAYDPRYAIVPRN